MSSPRPIVRVLFRVAGGRRLGFGHIARALSLARAMDAPAVLSVRGTHEAMTIARRMGARTFTSSALAHAIAEHRPALVVIDDPDAAAAQQALSICRRNGVRVASVHDLAIASIPSDIAIDGSIVQPGSLDATTTLVGSRYAILDPALFSPHPQPPLPEERGLRSENAAKRALTGVAMANGLTANAKRLARRAAAHADAPGRGRHGNVAREAVPAAAPAAASGHSQRANSARRLDSSASAQAGALGRERHADVARGAVRTAAPAAASSNSPRANSARRQGSVAPAQDAPRVLVSLGGGPRRALGLRIARAVKRARPEAAVTLAGGFAVAPHAAQNSSRAAAPAVQWLRAPEDFRFELARTDVAVLAGGVTLYEAAALGVAAVALAVVPAQAPTVRGFAARRAVLDAGSVGDGRAAASATAIAEAVTRRVTRLLDDERLRQRIARRARGLVDGRGAWRVASALRELVTAS